LSGRGGHNTLVGGAGVYPGATSTVMESGDVNFTLTNTSLKFGSNTDTLVHISNANLTGGASANTFDLTGWTGSAKLDGQGGIDTLIGPNLSNTWNITGQNAGNINSNLVFLSMEKLT